MRYEQRCPKPDCPTNAPNSMIKAAFRKKGFFPRKYDARLVQRYQCKACGTYCSTSTFSPTYRQRKPYINSTVAALCVSGVSQRRAALIIRTTRGTIARKQVFLAGEARKAHAAWLAAHGPFDEVQFDDMETFEHTKLKPLSIPMVVDPKSRCILAVDVARMPAKGLLAALSRRKYGPRKDERPTGWRSVFEAIKPFVPPGVRIKSDSNPMYPKAIARVLPQARRTTVLSRRGCVVGQGELKACGWDPLFGFNHNAAMVRDGLKRLSRRSWCTTKKPSRLADQLAIYVDFHNTRLVKRTT